MRLIALIERLQTYLPSVSPREVACIAMLICDRDPELQCINDPADFRDMVDATILRIRAADDQHAAVASELDQLASTEPCEFDPQHLWLLIRAIKVQSQLVDMYTGERQDSLCSS